MAVMRATGRCELHETARVRSQARSAGNGCGSVSKLVGVRDCEHLRENGVLTRFVMAVGSEKWLSSASVMAVINSLMCERKYYASASNLR